MNYLKNFLRSIAKSWYEKYKHYKRSNYLMQDDATKSLMKGGCELEATPYLETFLAYLAKKKKLDITIFYFKSTKKISTRCSFGHAERPTMQFVCIQDHYFLPISKFSLSIGEH